jgi:hypothetical protein
VVRLLLIEQKPQPPLGVYGSYGFRPFEQYGNEIDNVKIHETIEAKPQFLLQKALPFDETYNKIYENNKKIMNTLK